TPPELAPRPRGRSTPPPRTRLLPSGYARRAVPASAAGMTSSKRAAGRGRFLPAGGSGSYQLPHGSSAGTAMTANNRVRYAIDRWNRRMGAGLALGRTAPAHAPPGTFRLSPRHATPARAPP